MYFASDPGKNGGLVWVIGNPTLEELPYAEMALEKMPETYAEIEAMTSNNFAADDLPLRAWIENVPQLVGGGVECKNLGHVSAKLHGNFGFVHGVAHAHTSLRNLPPPVLLAPVKWQNAVGIRRNRAEDSDRDWKNRLKFKAQELFPGRKVTLWNADALLILWAGVKLMDEKAQNCKGRGRKAKG